MYIFLILFFCRNLSCAWRFDCSRNTSEIIYTFHHKGMGTTLDRISLYGGMHALFCRLPRGLYVIMVYTELGLGGRVTVFSGTFNNISVSVLWSVLLVGGLECQRKPSTCRNSLTKFTAYFNMLYWVHLVWVGFELTNTLMIGTDCIGICKSKSHTITTTTHLVSTHHCIVCVHFVYPSINPVGYNRVDCVVVSVLVWSAVDRGFELLTGQTNDFENWHMLHLY